MKKLCVLIVMFISISVFSQAPDWAWANAAGGGNSDFGRSICTDVNGNVFLAGYFPSSSITFGSTVFNTPGGFLVKYDNNGNVLWANYVGGYVLGVATDRDGNALITGTFIGASITIGTTTLANTDTFGFTREVFIAKYDSTGNVLWAKSCGGTDNDYSHSISTDSNGNVFITGEFRDTVAYFDTTTIVNSSVNSYDIFIAKYDSGGNVLWARSAGGLNNESGTSIGTDPFGNAYITGNFNSPFATFGATTLINANVGYDDMFIAKYDSVGNPLWATSAGGASWDVGSSISTDTSGSVVVVGYFRSTAITFAAITLTNAGAYDIFMVKHDSAGNVVWAKSYGGTSDDRANGVSSDVNGNLFMTGNFYGGTITFGSTTLSNAGNDDIIVVKYDEAGNELWAKSVGGPANEMGLSISNDTVGNVFITGGFEYIPITFGTTTLLNMGVYDVYVAKLDTALIITHDGSITSLNILDLVAPNPTAGQFVLDLENVSSGSISITNIFGEVVYRSEVSGKDHPIDVSSQPNGIYFVSVISEGETFTQKIVIQK